MRGRASAASSRYCGARTHPNFAIERGLAGMGSAVSRVRAIPVAVLPRAGFGNEDSRDRLLAVGLEWLKERERPVSLVECRAAQLGKGGGRVGAPWLGKGSTSRRSRTSLPLPTITRNLVTRTSGIAWFAIDQGSDARRVVDPVQRRSAVLRAGIRGVFLAAPWPCRIIDEHAGGYAF